MRIAISFLVLLVLAACNGLTVGGGAVEQKIKPVGQATATAPTDATTGDTQSGATQTAEVPIVIDNNNPLISDSQNFDAVSGRLTAEADKARLEALKKKFTLIAPTALPTRGPKTVSIVEYALSSTNAVGEKKYSRGFGGGKTASARNCAKFSSSDDAQVTFLKAGGPKRDLKNLDPDGDGFACDWSPDTYRKLIQ